MADIRPVPYPADTRAKGWRFELDYEQIDQSDTWDVAAEIPMAQHALLMMWLVAWRQEPCGSLPKDEAIIRAKCKLSPKLWAAAREVLMRGWWEAEDGRLYQDTIVQRVLHMLDKRANDAQRAANRRARAADERATPSGITSESRVTPPESGVSSTPSTKHQAPEPEEGKKTNTARKRAAAPQLVSVDDMVSEGVDRQNATDWLVARKAKNLPLTPTAWADTKAEAEKAGLSVPDAIKRAAAAGWGGFKAKWLTPDGRGSGQSTGETAWQRNRRERVADLAPGVARQAPPISQTAVVIEEGVRNVVAIAGR